MKFYKRDPDAAIAGMNQLTFEQRGAYNSLLDLLYSRDGDVPDDDNLVARMIGAHWREWGRLKRELIAAGKVWSEGGKLCANRVQEVLREAAETSQTQRRRVAERWQKSKKPNENKDRVIQRGNTNTPIATPIIDVIATAITSGASASARVDGGKGTRIPDGFLPNNTCLEKAERLGITVTSDMIASFADYWRSVPGARGRKCDWQATFRNFLDFPSHRKHANGKSRHTIRDSIEQAIAFRRFEDAQTKGGGGSGEERAALLPRLRKGAA